MLSAKPEQHFDDPGVDVCVWNVKTDTDGDWWVVEGDGVPIALRLIGENAAAAGWRTYTVGSSASLSWADRNRQQSCPSAHSSATEPAACRSLSQPLFRVSRNQGVTH